MPGDRGITWRGDKYDAKGPLQTNLGRQVNLQMVPGQCLVHGCERQQLTVAARDPAVAGGYGADAYARHIRQLVAKGRDQPTVHND